MAHKEMDQASFVEALLRPDVGVNRRLERIDRMVNWAPLAALVKPVRSGAWGRPSYPPLAMLKARFCSAGIRCPTKAWRRRCRIGYRSGGFAGLPWTTRPPTPMVCRFRLALVAADLPERLFAELDRQLEAKGLFVKSGTRSTRA